MTGSVRRSALKVRHLILFVLCLMYFVAYVDRVNISVAGPAMRKDLGLTPIELGLIFSAFAYPYAAMQIAGGWAADRFGPRLVLAALSLLWAAATILTGLSWSVASLVVFRVLVGLGEGGAFPAATRAFTWWLPVRERGFAQGITHSFARLGGAVTPPHRAGDRGAIRMARVVHRARRGESGVDRRLGGVVQGHAGGRTHG